MTTALRVSTSARTTAVTFLIGQLSIAVAALLVNILAARVMGPGGRGQIALILQISYVLAVLALAGTDRAYPVAMPGALAGGMRQLMAPGIAITAAGCAVAALVLHTDPQLATIAGLLALVTAGNAMLTGLRAADAAASTRTYLPAALTGQAALVTTACVLAVTETRSVIAWILAYALCLAIPAGALWARTRNQTQQNVRAARTLGWKLLPGTLAGIIAMRADRLILPTLAGYDQLGLYVVVATMTELIAWPVQAWADAHTSAWRGRHLDGLLRPAPILAAVTGYATTAAAVAAGTVWLLLVPIFGDAYEPARALAVPLAGAAAAYAISRAAIALALAAGRPRTAVAADTTAMITAVVAYAWLIPVQGASGAAWGSLAAYASATCVALIAGISGSRHGKDPVRDDQSDFAAGERAGLAGDDQVGGREIVAG